MTDQIGNGERPRGRRAVERMTKRLVQHGGMTPREAELKAREHAKRYERGAVRQRQK